MSFKPEVIADNSGKWCGNALAFATEVEAKAWASDLASRWFSVREYRVVESTEPVTHRWIDDGQHRGIVEAREPDSEARMPARSVQL